MKANKNKKFVVGNKNVKKNNFSLYYFIVFTLITIILVLIIYIIFFDKSGKTELKEKEIKIEPPKIESNEKDSYKNILIDEPKILKESFKDNDLEKKEPKFSFYNSLANQEVKIKVDIDNKKEKYIYYLQIAAFRSEAQAKRLKQKVEKLNLNPFISKYIGQSTWYKVEVGPYNSIRESDAINHILQRNGINGSFRKMIKIKN